VNQCVRDIPRWTTAHMCQSRKPSATKTDGYPSVRRLLFYISMRTQHKPSIVGFVRYAKPDFPSTKRVPRLTQTTSFFLHFAFTIPCNNISSFSSLYMYILIATIQKERCKRLQFRSKIAQVGNVHPYEVDTVYSEFLEQNGSVGIE
jgi:hypothetical protein